MFEQISSLGSLFLLSTANQIIVPAPIDLIMLGMIKLGSNPIFVVLAVVFGSTIGAVLDYYVGKLGIENIGWIKKKTNTRGYKKAKHFYEKYGYWTIFFSYAPFIGKYFPLIAGMMGTNVLKVIAAYVSGKIVYYSVVGTIILSFWK